MPAFNSSHLLSEVSKNLDPTSDVIGQHHSSSTSFLAFEGYKTNLLGKQHIDPDYIKAYFQGKKNGKLTADHIPGHQLTLRNGQLSNGKSRNLRLREIESSFTNGSSFTNRGRHTDGTLDFMDDGISDKYNPFLEVGVDSLFEPNGGSSIGANGDEVIDEDDYFDPSNSMADSRDALDFPDDGPPGPLDKLESKSASGSLSELFDFEDPYTSTNSDYSDPDPLALPGNHGKGTSKSDLDLDSDSLSLKELTTQIDKLIPELENLIPGPPSLLGGKGESKLDSKLLDSGIGNASESGLINGPTLGPDPHRKLAPTEINKNSDIHLVDPDFKYNTDYKDAAEAAKEASTHNTSAHKPNSLEKINKIHASKDAEKGKLGDKVDLLYGDYRAEQAKYRDDELDDLDEGDLDKALMGRFGKELEAPEAGGGGKAGGDGEKGGGEKVETPVGEKVETPVQTEAQTEVAKPEVPKPPEPTKEPDSVAALPPLPELPPPEVPKPQAAEAVKPPAADITASKTDVTVTVPVSDVMKQLQEVVGSTSKVTTPEPVPAAPKPKPEVNVPAPLAEVDENEEFAVPTTDDDDAIDAEEDDDEEEVDSEEVVEVADKNADGKKTLTAAKPDPDDDNDINSSENQKLVDEIMSEKKAKKGSDSSAAKEEKTDAVAPTINIYSDTKDSKTSKSLNGPDSNTDSDKPYPYNDGNSALPFLLRWIDPLPFLAFCTGIIGTYVYHYRSITGREAFVEAQKRKRAEIQLDRLERIKQYESIPGKGPLQSPYGRNYEDYEDLSPSSRRRHKEKYSQILNNNSNSKHGSIIGNRAYDDYYEETMRQNNAVNSPKLGKGYGADREARENTMVDEEFSDFSDSFDKTSTSESMRYMRSKELYPRAERAMREMEKRHFYKKRMEEIGYSPVNYHGSKNTKQRPNNYISPSNQHRYPDNNTRGMYEIHDKQYGYSYSPMHREHREPVVPIQQQYRVKFAQNQYEGRNQQSQYDIAGQIQQNQNEGKIQNMDTPNSNQPNVIEQRSTNMEQRTTNLGNEQLKQPKQGTETVPNNQTNVNPVPEGPNRNSVNNQKSQRSGTLDNQNIAQLQRSGSNLTQRVSQALVAQGRGSTTRLSDPAVEYTENTMLRHSADHKSADFRKQILMNNEIIHDSPENLNSDLNYDNRMKSTVQSSRNYSTINRQSTTRQTEQEQQSSRLSEQIHSSDYDNKNQQFLRYPEFVVPGQTEGVTSTTEAITSTTESENFGGLSPGYAKISLPVASETSKEGTEWEKEEGATVTGNENLLSKEQLLHSASITATDSSQTLNANHFDMVLNDNLDGTNASNENLLLEEIQVSTSKYPDSRASEADFGKEIDSKDSAVLVSKDSSDFVLEAEQGSDVDVTSTDQISAETGSKDSKDSDTVNVNATAALLVLAEEVQKSKEKIDEITITQGKIINEEKNQSQPEDSIMINGKIDTSRLTYDQNLNLKFLRKKNEFRKKRRMVQWTKFMQDLIQPEEILIPVIHNDTVPNENLPQLVLSKEECHETEYETDGKSDSKSQLPLPQTKEESFQAGETEDNKENIAVEPDASVTVPTIEHSVIDTEDYQIVNGNSNQDINECQYDYENVEAMDPFSLVDAPNGNEEITQDATKKPASPIHEVQAAADDGVIIEEKPAEENADIVDTKDSKKSDDSAESDQSLSSSWFSRAVEAFARVAGTAPIPEIENERMQSKENLVGSSSSSSGLTENERISKSSERPGRRRKRRSKEHHRGEEDEERRESKESRRSKDSNNDAEPTAADTDYNHKPSKHKKKKRSKKLVRVISPGPTRSNFSLSPVARHSPAARNRKNGKHSTIYGSYSTSINDTNDLISDPIPVIAVEHVKYTDTAAKKEEDSAEQSNSINSMSWIVDDISAREVSQSVQEEREISVQETVKPSEKASYDSNIPAPVGSTEDDVYPPLDDDTVQHHYLEQNFNEPILHEPDAEAPVDIDANINNPNYNTTANQNNPQLQEGNHNTEADNDIDVLGITQTQDVYDNLNNQNSTTKAITPITPFDTFASSHDNLTNINPSIMNGNGVGQRIIGRLDLPKQLENPMLNSQNSQANTTVIKPKQKKINLDTLDGDSESGSNSNSYDEGKLD